MTSSPRPSLARVGFLCIDADLNPPLLVTAPATPGACDACGNPAVYGMSEVDGRSLHVGYCEPCVEGFISDPQGPDQWFAPVPR